LDFNEVYNLDYREFLQQIPEHSVELILTDLPYARKHLPLYEGLAEEAKRVLRIGGNLIAMCPNFMMPEVLSVMSQHLKWRWMIHYDYWHSSHARMAMGIEVCWKPLAWFVNEKLYPNRPIADSVRAGARDKSLHVWQQDVEWAEYIIKALTDEGDLVVDPFVGSGTVAVAAQLLRRKWLVNDLDERAVNTTIRRLEGSKCRATG